MNLHPLLYATLGGALVVAVSASADAQPYGHQDRFDGQYGQTQYNHGQYDQAQYDHGPPDQGQYGQGPRDHGPADHGPGYRGPGDHGPQDHGPGDRGRYGQDRMNHDRRDAEHRDWRRGYQAPPFAVSPPSYGYYTPPPVAYGSFPGLNFGITIR